MRQPIFSTNETAQSTLDAVLFDLDGTLADTLPVCIQAYQSTVAHFCGRTPDEAEIYAHFGPSEEGMLEEFIPGRLDTTLPYYLKCYEQFHAQCTQTFAGVNRLFALLHNQGIHTAIVTGKGPKSAEISMRILGLDRWVEIVEAGYAFGGNKPYSMGLVLERWGIPANRAAYVGDAPSDILAARTAALLPVGAAWSETSQLRGDPITQDSLTFYHVGDFIHWIEESRLSLP